MSVRPYVSVGIPVYNGGKLFRETLESFLTQSFTDFELVVVDNASTDATEEIAREFAGRDQRVRYFRNATNIGLSKNHNRVFEASCGKYFKWAPADDICCPTYLERCVEVLDRNPDVILAYPKTRFVNHEGTPLPIEDPGWNLVSGSAAERFRFVLFHGHWANAVMGLIRRSALEKTRLMPDYPGGDFRVLGELSTMGKFYEVPEYLFIRRLHERSSSQHTSDPGWQAEYWATQKRMPWPFLQLKADQWLTIMRSPSFTGRERASLVASLLRSIVGGRRRVLHEFQSHLHFFFTNRARGSAPREP